MEPLENTLLQLAGCIEKIGVDERLVSWSDGGFLAEGSVSTAMQYVFTQCLAYKDVKDVHSLHTIDMWYEHFNTCDNRRSDHFDVPVERSQWVNAIGALAVLCEEKKNNVTNICLCLVPEGKESVSFLEHLMQMHYGSDVRQSTLQAFKCLLACFQS